VRFHTKGPNPILSDQVTNIGVMSKAWAEKNNVQKPQNYKDKEDTFAVRNTNGTGPFRLVRREPDARTELARNADWWGHKDDPHNIDRIVFTPIKNDGTRVAALLSGEIDIVTDPPVQDIARINASRALHSKQINQIRAIFLGMDMARPELRVSDVKGKNPFADKRVRQAVYQAIDIEAIKTRVMRGEAIPAGSTTSPGVHGYLPSHDKRLSFSQDGARKLLAEAGYPNGFSTKLDCPNDRYVKDEDICQAITAMLARINIKVQLDLQSKSLHFPKLQKKESDFFMLGWGVPTLDSHYVFSFLYASKGAWNFTGYSNPKVDELTDAMSREVQADKRDRMILDTWQQVLDDIVYIPLHHQIITWSMASKFDTPINAIDTPQWRWARFKK